MSPHQPDQVTHIDLVHQHKLMYLRPHYEGSTMGVFKDLTDASRVTCPFSFVRAASPYELQVA